MKFDLQHTFITSDHHFGSWKLPWSFMRVFTEEQENELVDKWNSTVKTDDTVIYAGDFHDCILDDLLKYRTRLNGSIHLVRGNHDKFSNAIYEAVFGNPVHDALLIEDLDVEVVHNPDARKNGLMRYKVYGHLHRGYNNDIQFDSKSFCACVSHNNGFPVKLADALDMMKNFRTK